MLAEDLLRRLKPQTRAWCVVKPVTQVAYLLMGHIQHNGLRRQVTPDPLVGVLDSAFLPWRLWVTEPGRRSHALFQLSPRDEFETTVKRQTLPGLRGQGRQMAYQLVHDRFGTPVVVAKQNGIAALAFDNRGTLADPCSFLKIIRSGS